MSDPRCAKCGHPRSNHPYRHPFVGSSKDDTIEELEADLRKMALDFIAADGQAAEAYQAKLAKAEGLLVDAMVQLENGKIKTRRNCAYLIVKFLAELKGETDE